MLLYVAVGSMSISVISGRCGSMVCCVVSGVAFSSVSVCVFVSPVVSSSSAGCVGDAVVSSFVVGSGSRRMMRDPGEVEKP